MNQVAGEKPAARRAVIIYDTLFGNTKKIAEALQLGLNETGIETLCLNTKDVAFESLKGFDLIALGAPTQAFSSSRPMKEFLQRLKGVSLSGKYGFAFDTKLDSRLSGSAAKYIENELVDQGIQIILPRASALVEGNTKHSNLKGPEEIRFHQIGVQVGTALLAAKGRMIPA